MPKKTLDTQFYVSMLTQTTIATYKMEVYSNLMEEILLLIFNKSGLTNSTIKKESINQIKPILDLIPIAIWINDPIDPVYLNKYGKTYHNLTDELIDKEKTSVYARYMPPENMYEVYYSTRDFHSTPNDILIHHHEILTPSGTRSFISSVSKSLGPVKNGKMSLSITYSFDLVNAFKESRLKDRVEQVVSSIKLVDSILTNREIQILELLAMGKSSTEIAEHLGNLVSSTVDRHRRNLCDKLGAKNSTHAVAIGYKLGFL